MKFNYNTVFEKEILIEIAREMQKAHFKPGYDNMSAQGAETWIEINYDNLLAQLKDDKFKPQPLSGFSVTKSNGKFRQLVKPCAIDMIVQKAFSRYLYELTEPLFSSHIHAYIKNRGVTTAVKEFCEFAAMHNYTLKIDPSDFFGSMDHSVLENALTSINLSKKLISLIMKFVTAPVIENGKASRRKKGIPQGIPLSPILANLYLLPLDHFLEEQGCNFIRYADDVAVFGDDVEELQSLYLDITELFENKLALQMNNAKCAVDIPERLTFLGYSFEKNSNGFVSFDQQIPRSAVNYNWSTSTPKKNNRHITVLSNGILSKKDFALRFSSDNDKYDIPVYGCDNINVYSDVVFDSNFLAQAAKNRVIVSVFNDRGKKLGSFIPENRLLSPPVTIEQLQAYGDKKQRLYLASRFVLGSIHNLRLNIRYYRKNYRNRLFTESLNAIDALEKLVKKCSDYNELLMLEERVRNAYYHCFDAFIRAEGFSFDKRTRRPPKNEVNAMLSFGYTILYNLLATEIQKTALDVRVGFLHATNKRRESLNLDLAELFKPLIVDRVVFSMINRNMIDAEKHFEHMENGTVYLNSEGKHIFLRTLFDKLDARVTVGKQSVSYHTIIDREIKKLVNYFRNDEKRYNPFKQVR